MALHDIREVRIPIELDKHPHAVFRPERLRRAGGQIRLSGSSIAFQKMQQGSVKAPRTLLWAGLLHEDETLTERREGAMISMTNVETIMEQIIQALTVALPEDTDSSENVVAPDPQ